MALPVADNFNRSNANPAGGNWSTPTGAGAVQIDGNVLTGLTGSGDSIGYWNADTFADNQWAEADCGGNTSTDGGPAIRIATGAASAYGYNIGATHRLAKLVNGSFTTLQTISDTAGASDRYRIQAIGTTLRVFKNGVQIGTDQTDSSLSAGSAGVWVYGNQPVDNWAAGNTDIVVAVPSDGLSLTGYAPDIVVSDNAIFTPPTINLALTGYAPDVTISGSPVVYVPTANLTLDLQPPTVTASSTALALVPAATIALAAHAPDILVSHSVILPTERVYPLNLTIDGIHVDASTVTEYLPRAVLISLFTWRRANKDDSLPGDDRFGWWADQYSDTPGDRIGSRLWLLLREKMTAETVARAKEYAEEALQWLLDDGVATSVQVRSERQGLDRLALGVTITRGDRAALNIRFANVWNYLNAI